jgi:hypothetical protein
MAAFYGLREKEGDNEAAWRGTTERSLRIFSGNLNQRPLAQ